MLPSDCRNPIDGIPASKSVCRWLLIFALHCSACLLVFAPVVRVSAQAQATVPEVVVDASLLGRRIAVGQGGTFIVRVANGRPETLPREIKADGLTIRYQDDDLQGRIVNGMQQVDYFYYYTVVGSAAGTFTIPAVKVKVRGADYSTEPLDLAIYEPGSDDLSLNASQPYFLRLDVLQTDVYAHQMVPVEISVYARGRGSLRQIDQPNLGESDFVIKPFPRAQMTETVDIDGFEYTRARLASSTFALRTGDQQLGPVELDARIEKSVSRSTPGFRSIFSRTETVTMTSNPASVQVKPLPVEGRPADFADTVGNFEMTAIATPTDVKVGDPISVDVIVSGIGNFDNVPVPAFLGGDANLWRTYEARRSQDPTQTSDGVTPGRVTFTQIVIPQSQVTEVPSFTFSYFDPQTASYQTLRTAPVAVRVAADTPAPGPATASTIGAAGAEGSTTSAGKPSATLTDILSIKTRNPSWTRQAADVKKRWYYWLPQMLPAALVLFLVGGVATRFVRGRLGSQSAARHQASYASLRKNLRSPSAVASRATFYHQAQRCIDAWRQENPDSDARLPMASAGRLTELEQRIHSLLYSGAATDRNQPPSDAEIDQAAGTLDQMASSLR